MPRTALCDLSERVGGCALTDGARDGGAFLASTGVHITSYEGRPIMGSHRNVNRPVRTSTAPLPKEVVDVSLEELVEEDTLVEEVSIDGMCGVY